MFRWRERNDRPKVQAPDTQFRSLILSISAQVHGGSYAFVAASTSGLFQPAGQRRTKANAGEQ